MRVRGRKLLSPSSPKQLSETHGSKEACLVGSGFHGWIMLGQLFGWMSVWLPSLALASVKPNQTTPEQTQWFDYRRPFGEWELQLLRLILTVSQCHVMSFASKELPQQCRKGITPGETLFQFSLIQIFTRSEIFKVHIFACASWDGLSMTGTFILVRKRLKFNREATHSRGNGRVVNQPKIWA